MKRGFSLVELSIVLVILGLLVGGVLAGQSLIRAAQLRAVTTEYQRYLAATNSFRDKYFALPGDMTNAISFWGKDNTNCAGATGTITVPGTCNGDGNGQIANFGGGSNEMYLYWQHLADAGLIEGSYIGVGVPSTGWNSKIGANVPASKMTPGGWTVYWLGALDNTNPQWFAGNYGNIFMFGSQGGNNTYETILKPEEAWNIDTKMDDGMPQYGRLTQFKTGSTGSNACSTTTNPATAAYPLSSSAISCSFTMILAN